MEEAKGRMGVVTKLSATTIVGSGEGAARNTLVFRDEWIGLSENGRLNRRDLGTNGHGDLLIKIRTLPTGTVTPARAASPAKEF
jgi:hypothetical protein